jgi:hypothetical protein
MSGVISGCWSGHTLRTVAHEARSIHQATSRTMIPLRTMNHIAFLGYVMKDESSTRSRMRSKTWNRKDLGSCS